MGVGVEDGKISSESSEERVVDEEFARDGVEESILRADPSMFVTHLGTANLSPEVMIKALAYLMESVAKKNIQGPSKFEIQKAQDLLRAANILKNYGG